jgi:hypothetical protein
MIGHEVEMSSEDLRSAAFLVQYRSRGIWVPFFQFTDQQGELSRVYEEWCCKCAIQFAYMRVIFSPEIHDQAMAVLSLDQSVGVKIVKITELQGALWRPWLSLANPWIAPAMVSFACLMGGFRILKLRCLAHT